jgi:hypothetical protein
MDTAMEYSPYKKAGYIDKSRLQEEDMKIVRSILIGIIPIAATLLLAGCPEPDTRSIEITGVGWICENIDQSYWVSPPSPTRTQFMNFQIYYSGSDIEASDIETAIFRCQGVSGYWSFNLDPSNVDTTAKIIGVGGDRFYSSSLSTNGSVCPIGPTTFEVTLKNGSVSNFVLTVPPPNSDTWTTQTCVYNEDYTGSILSGYVPMLERAAVSSRNKTGTTATIQFTANDPTLFSGYVWFYDSSGNYVGRSNYLRSYGSGANPTFVNGGSGLNNNGANTLSIQAGDVLFQSGRTFSDIANFHVVLTDGNQYLGTSYTYDCRSIGAYLAFP